MYCCDDPGLHGHRMILHKCKSDGLMPEVQLERDAERQARKAEKQQQKAAAHEAEKATRAAEREA